MDVYFFSQAKLGRKAKRFRKDIEELPQSLRFAHLNPKVAAYLVNKERRSSIGDEADAILDATDNHKHQSLLPNIKETVTEIKHELDRTNVHDEDVSASLYKGCKTQSPTVIMQIATLLRYLQGHKIRISKTLEYHLLASYGDLVANAVYVYRQWQTKAARDAYEKERQRQERKEEEKERERSESEKESEKEREVDVASVVNHGKEAPEKNADKPVVKKNSKKLTKVNLADIMEVETEDTQDPPPAHNSKENVPSLNVTQVTKKHNSRTVASQRISKSSGRSSLERQHGDWLAVPVHRMGKRGSRAERGLSISSRDDLSTIGDYHSESSRISNAGHAGYYMSIISFALSSKACEEKGWILHSDKPDEKETVLEWAQHRLRLALHQIQEQEERSKEQGFDKPLENRYYGDAKKEALAKYQRRNVPNQKEMSPVLIEGIYPVIPSFMVEIEPDPGQVLCSTSTTDGTKSIFYPSGRLAIMISPVGIGKPGVYINAYDDTDEKTQLASFTPSGRVTCFHKNGVARFLATEKYAHIANVDGAITRKWKWPQNPNTKLPLTVVINMNNELSFRCMNQSSMQFIFSCQKETITWCVAPTPGAVEPKEREDFGHLMSNTHFTSQTAKEFNKSHKLRTQQQKPKVSRVYTNKQKDKIKSQLSEMKNQSDTADQYVSEYERELARLQTKVKVLTEDWLEFYRTAVGMKSPISKLTQDRGEANPKRISRSPHGAPPSLAVPPLSVTDENKAATSSVERIDASEQSLNSKINQTNATEDAAGDSQASLKTDTSFDYSLKSQIPGIIEVPPSPSSIPLIRGSTSAISSAKSRITSAIRLHRSNGWACPIALRKEILGEGDVNCRCHRYKIPYVMDVEFDEFIGRYVCEKQLLVISVVSSLYPESNTSQHMLEVLYSELNKNRTHPCLQSTGDPFRIFLYDIASAAELSNCTKPLLLRRHNAAAGMFLIYQRGNLVFCDHIWNGYGNARKDFYKQMMKTKQDALMGSCLPRDFRFSPSKGHRGKRSAWGGEIGGAGVDKHGSPGLSIESTMMPDTSRPASASSTSSDSREVLRPSFQIRSLTSGGFYPPLTPLPSGLPIQRAVTAPLHNKTNVLRKSAPVR
ncbi:uncharacterized protein LOC141900272 [Tubulanus polymorphus]|uniref:uncharacterized protein LOC141900272 n=1 Tax=Tubulanus polymorphus TaxID=672921 RepID=UPI003DA684E4